MRKGWEIKKIKDVVDFQRGLTYSKKDEVDFSDNIVLRSNNVSLITNKLDFSELKYINSKIIIPESKKVTKGSLIICTANGSKSHLGKVALIDDDYNYAFGGFMGLIKPKQNLNPIFLYYLMTSDAYKKFISKLSDGANINNLKFSDLGDFEIPLPPLSEQQEIVSILDAAFESIERAKSNAEQNLKNAQELFDSYLQDIFENKDKDWEEKRFEDLTTLITCGVAATPKYVEESEGIPFLSAQNVKDGKVVLDKYRYISKQFHQELTKKNKPKKGDILYSRVGSKFGEAGVVEHEFEFSVYVSLTLIKPKAEILDNYYLKYYLNSPLIKDLAKKSISSSGVPNLNVKEVREFPIKCPPILIQKKIVKEIEIVSSETKKLEAIYQQKLNDLEELKKSMLQKAFNGELKTSKISA